jgi:hypothetical protein
MGGGPLAFTANEDKRYQLVEPSRPFARTEEKAHEQ